MQTIHLNPDERQAVSRVTEAIEGLLAEGKGVTVTVAEDREYLSPQQAADRLGFSRQHLVRLINAGELPAEKLANSSYWKIPIASVVAFEERRERGRLRADEFSRGLDELGAPLEGAAHFRPTRFSTRTCSSLECSTSSSDAQQRPPVS